MLYCQNINKDFKKEREKENSVENSWYWEYYSIQTWRQVSQLPILYYLAELTTKLYNYMHSYSSLHVTKIDIPLLHTGNAR